MSWVPRFKHVHHRVRSNSLAAVLMLEFEVDRPIQRSSVLHDRDIAYYMSRVYHVDLASSCVAAPRSYRSTSIGMIV